MKKMLWGSMVVIAIICIAILFVFVRFPTRYTNYINEYSNKYNVPKDMVASVINIESGYDKNAISESGACGLMQIMPSTAFDMASRLDIDISYEDLFVPEININLGCYYLRYLLDMFDGNKINTLSAYNWGLRSVKNWIASGNVDENGNVINIPVLETQNYLKKYNTNEFVYKNILKFK